MARLPHIPLTLLLLVAAATGALAQPGQPQTRLGIVRLAAPIVAQPQRQNLAPAAMPRRPLPPTQALGADRAMQVVTQRAEELVEHGFSLASRNAFYSARAEFLAALRSVAEALDVRMGGRQHMQSLEAGLTALREGDDFVPKTAEAQIDVALIVEGHQTPVLKDNRGTRPTALVARQLYYTYAQRKLVEACGGNRAASRALYGLGKLYTVRSLTSSDPLLQSGPKAVVFHGAALQVDPRNALAANELGVLLARYGELEQARDVLLQGLMVQPLPEAWHNLAVVHQRLGQPELARRARFEWHLALSRQGSGKPSQSSPQPVRWVDPATFSRTDRGLHPGPVPARVQPTPPPASQAGRLPWHRR